MKESIWLYLFLIVGLLGLFLINFVGQLSTSNEQNYYLLKETTEAAMFDAVDLRAYRVGVGYDGITRETAPDYMHCDEARPGTVRIVREKFVESLTRRFAENAEMNKEYTIVINDIDECPPKVSVTIKAKQQYDFFSFFSSDYDSSSTEIVNELTAILENIPNEQK